jgi:hypothetical protein
MRLALYPTLFGAVFGGALAGFWGFVAGALGMPLLAAGIYKMFVGATGGAISNALMPGTAGQAGVPYSHIEALEARGDIAGALAAWEAAIEASPDAVAARINAADLYAGKGGNHGRAAELFRAVQQHRTASPETQRYASQRLIDLYLGPLNDQGRALVELRRLAERWPDTPEGAGARKAIRDIKGT